MSRNRQKKSATKKALRLRYILFRIGLCAAMTIPIGVPGVACAESSVDDTTTVRLIKLLIEKGILTKGQAASLLTQAGAPAHASSSSSEERIRRANLAASARSAPSSQPINSAETATETPSGEVRVTYVPQFVRDQIAAQVRTQVMQQAQSEGWAKPNEIPNWVDRVSIYGDFRLRYQLNIEDKGNRDAATGLPYPFPNFDAIDSNGGFDTSGSGLPPLINVTENRDRYRIRARVGVHAQITDWITSDVRIATGNDPSPVSENQTLGRPGDFQNYAVYVDQAYLKISPTNELTFLVGRAPDPYFVTGLMYYRELNFDGVSAQYDPKISRSLSLFFNGGAYPVFNTDLNFSSESLTKGSSRDAYLLAAQAGVQWRIGKDYVATLGAGYFNYSNITGKESAPCLLLTSSDTCSTDNTIPTFQQVGNTVFPVRNILVSASSLPATPELYGLASHFGIFDAHGRFDVHIFDPVTISLDGDFVKNLAFSRSYILARNPSNNIGSNNLYQGGDTGYLARLLVGYPDVEQAWDWNFSLTYKYVASDAVLDALTDPDFHLGGTNAKGYILGGVLGLANHTNLTVRWLSATQVSGPPNGNDVLQVDVNTKF